MGLFKFLKQVFLNNLHDCFNNCDYCEFAGFTTKYIPFLSKISL